MRERLFNFAAAASTLLCAVVIVLIWYTTSRTHYYAFYQTYLNDPLLPHDGVCRIELGGGQFTAVRRYDDRGWLHADMKNVMRGWRRGSVPAQTSLRLYRALPRPELSLHFDEQGWVIAVPLWLIALLATALPLVWLARAARNRITREPGRCCYCGYDLRATPDRCPECGKVSPEPPHNPPMQRTAAAGTGAVE